MSLSRVNIKEANDHLKQVHQRVYELENQVHMQAMHAEELQKSNLELQHRLQEVLRQKEEAVRTKEAEVSLGMSTCAASLVPRRSHFPVLHTGSVQKLDSGKASVMLVLCPDPTLS